MLDKLLSIGYYDIVLKRTRQHTRRTKKMTIANKIAMELAINNLPANTPCPEWFMWTLIGMVGALVIGAVVAIIAVNK